MAIFSCAFYIVLIIAFPFVCPACRTLNTHDCFPGKLFYTRNYLWKDWVSPPLDNFQNGHKPSFRKAQEDNRYYHTNDNYIVIVICTAQPTLRYTRRLLGLNTMADYRLLNHKLIIR